MKPGIWTYENAERQIVWFRGYVRKYTGRTVEEIPCGEVRKSRGAALKDAKALIVELRGKV